MKFKNIFLLTFSLIIAISVNKSTACTNFLVTKGATVDGSTIISYAADSHIRYGELYYSPSRHWPAGSLVTIYDRSTAKPLGQIPQIEYTYQTIGFMNEHQLAIGESTFGGRPELVDTTGIMDYAALMFIALQRAKTAREAIKVIAELVEKHGYASSGESFSIGDKNEVWIMEIIGKGTEWQTDKKTKQSFNSQKGAVWVAVKIPDGYISAHANHARITQIPAEDGKQSISSKILNKIFNPEVEVVFAHDAISFAREKGYFSGADADFSFSDVYAPLTFDAARFCEIRVWTFFNQVADGMEEHWDYATGKNLEKRMPLYVKPAKKLTPQDLMAAKRNHLQETELDMSKDAGAGPFEMPYRWRPLTWKYNDREYFNERTVQTQQTGFSFIAQMRNWLPDPIGGINWFGVDDAGTTVYVPFYCGINRVPKIWSEGYGDILTYKSDAAFWVFNRVAHFAYLFYNRVMPDVQKVQSELENKFATYTPAVDAAALQLWEIDSTLAREFITDYSCNTGDYTVKRWSELGDFLLVKFLDGNVKQEKDGEFLRNPWGYPQSPSFPGYPESWKKEVIEHTGDKLLYPSKQE
ncbi:MAG: dipeptidase [Draconibacterium sp.]